MNLFYLPTWTEQKLSKDLGRLPASRKWRRKWALATLIAQCSPLRLLLAILYRLHTDFVLENTEHALSFSLKCTATCLCLLQSILLVVKMHTQYTDLFKIFQLQKAPLKPISRHSLPELRETHLPIDMPMHAHGCSANVHHHEEFGYLYFNSREDRAFAHAHVDDRLSSTSSDSTGEECEYSHGKSGEPPLSPYSCANSAERHHDSRSLATADENGESSETYNKHRTYPDLIQARFVENLYVADCYTLDVCSEALWRLNTGSECSQFKISEFKSRQNGDWRWRVVSKPYKSPCLTLGLLRNPWVNHFRHQASSPIKSTRYHQMQGSRC